MPRSVPTIVVLAAALLVPLAASAQENSIMQSFHPEKYPSTATEAGKQTEPDRAQDTSASRVPEKAEPSKADK